MSTKTPVQKFMFRVADEIVNKAKKLAPADTANLKKDIQVFNDNIKNLELEVGNTMIAPYAKYVHEGTGIHGKHKRRIKPKKKKALKTPFGVFKSVAGQEAQPYLLDAAKDALTQNNLSKMADSMTEELGEEIVKDLKDNFEIEIG